ncbi:hypothetical protein [Spongiactinospora sp. TRM90649]|uniref:hypothetical protein n=1 Tax=Spongiactinospora sp. TRM90649 TaxID=3031114 RepID=UPI0023F82EB1|nr:hypothetical protein [Spongiactinospora sp. TRM90649]MDF5756450.1 hypothetical protein [Spongiactinospora sp. TRM90649]
MRRVARLFAVAAIAGGLLSLGSAASAAVVPAVPSPTDAVTCLVHTATDPAALLDPAALATPAEAPGVACLQPAP